MKGDLIILFIALVIVLFGSTGWELVRMLTGIGFVAFLVVKPYIRKRSRK